MKNKNKTVYDYKRVYLRPLDKEKLEFIARHHDISLLYALRILIEREFEKIQQESSNDNK